MIRLGALLIAASFDVSAAAAAVQPHIGGVERQEDSPASTLSLLDVPYLSQTEALCGGAAAAMVLRYWGASTATPDEFASLVDGSRSGIPTASLVRAVQDRGYEALAASGTPALVRRELTAGRPVIALIEDRPSAFHYVVIVGWHDRAVVLHDPARTPYVLMTPGEFERRWSAAHRWMLATAPGSKSQSAAGESSRTAESHQSEARVAAPSGCDALIADGVRLAQRRELARAEPLLTTAAYQCSGAGPLRELAGLRLLQRRWPEVRDLSARALQHDPADAHAWRLLATARFVEGDHGGALDAWNRLGEPRVELVSVAGLHRTPHGAVERYLRIGSGAVLTRAASRRAERRLKELPAATMARLEYLPKPAGKAEVRAHVVERTLLPHGRLTWTAIALHAAVDRELSVPLSSPGRRGERLDVLWRFWPGRPAAGVSLEVPASIGLVSFELTAEHQPFDDPQLPRAERIQGRVALADWVSGSLRVETRAGVARWSGSGPIGVFGGASRFDSGPFNLRADLDGWLGGQTFVTGRLQGVWRSSHLRLGTVMLLAGGVDAVSKDAPLDLWPAGDTGHARPMLLRAHPALDGGRLRTERLGRVVTQATAEAQQWWGARLAAVGGAVFVDAARTFQRSAPLPQVGDVDVGAGLRLALPGRDGAFRADVARGLRDGRMAFSVGWTPN